MDSKLGTAIEDREVGEDERGAEFEMLVGGGEGIRKEEGVWICRICNKEFASGKSLGGHMRVHKKRQQSCLSCPKTFSSSGRSSRTPFQTIIPPDSFSTDTAPSSTIDSEMEESCSPSPSVDLLTCLDGISWAPCKKPRTNHSTAAVDSGLTRDEMGAVNGLMLLATGDARYRFLDYGGKKRKQPSEKMLLPFNTPTQNKRKKAGTPNRSYNCTDCNKSYPTPQALGGHRSSAHKPVPVLQFGMHQEAQITTDNAVGTPLPVIISHICRFCNKQFPSKYALGGHMRHHKDGPTPGSAAPRIGSFTTPNTSKESAEFGFDLNELPEIDDCGQI